MKPGDQVAGRGEARESRVIIFPSVQFLQHRVQPLKLLAHRRDQARP